mgnify:FL=1
MSRDRDDNLRSIQRRSREMRRREERVIEEAEIRNARLTYDFVHHPADREVEIIAILHINKPSATSREGEFIRKPVAVIPDFVLWTDELPDDVANALWRLDIRLVPLLQFWLRAVHAPKTAGQRRLQAPNEALASLAALAATLQRKNDFDLVRPVFEREPELARNLDKAWGEVRKGLVREGML